jgi:superfamily II DNA or RNA helicase
MSDHDELKALRAENTRLTALLDAHGITWRLSAESAAFQVVNPLRFTTGDKIALFRKLFRGRADVYSIRWESKVSGKAGYTPACANEWRNGICEKPRVKCGDCANRVLLPLTDAVLYKHLTGEYTVGVYPLMEDGTCCFLAVDFDEADWRDDARAFMQSCDELDIPAALEISRSGKGAHVWIFFANAVLASNARRLGTAIISYTCARTRQLKLSSYDRLFPNQDTMPKGGFGNLIALPLQKRPREEGFSVFVDTNLRPHSDQWRFLAAITLIPEHDIETIILRAMDGAHPLDVTFIDDEDLATPWKRSSEHPRRLAGEMPATLTVTLANQIYFEKTQLPQALANRLIRLAAFQNPEFYRAQVMRISVWDKPRVIGCAENYPQHIALPRGCFDAVNELLMDNDVRLDLRDERYAGDSIAIDFVGTLRPDQEAAISTMLCFEAGVLCAPTAFGKTVMAAALIARRGVNTLVLVHRAELLKHWQERLAAFLSEGKDMIGAIGGGKAKPTGKIDIAMMQSLSRRGEIHSLVENYGQVIVDECHHVGAASFDAILRRVKAKYVVGLTATPIRRDGQQPIIFMQCGPIRHKAIRTTNALHDLVVRPYFLQSQTALPHSASIQDVFRHLAQDPIRTNAIASVAIDAFQQGRKVLVLTERTDHLDAIQAALTEKPPRLFVLHGRVSKKQRATLIAALDTSPHNAPRVLLATGKLIGEGFDHPPLDMLVLAMPISWKGTLQQYAGRLHREHANKTNVCIVDFVDAGHPALLRMWDKRQRGYRAMGYRMEVDA